MRIAVDVRAWSESIFSVRRGVSEDIHTCCSQRIYGVADCSRCLRSSVSIWRRVNVVVVKRYIEVHLTSYTAIITVACLAIHRTVFSRQDHHLSIKSIDLDVSAYEAHVIVVVLVLVLLL